MVNLSDDKKCDVLTKLKTPSHDKNYIGFGNLPNQLFSKISQQGVQFNILLIGESGRGSTTLINTLFNAKILAKKTYNDPLIRNKLSIEITEVLLKEGDFKMHLRVYRAVGFGDLLENKDCWSTILKCLIDRFEEYYQAESSLERPPVLNDCRIHCCLYLINSRLRQIDVCTMKEISSHVAIIPVITKADMLTNDEKLEVKTCLMEEFASEGIEIYDFSKLDFFITEEMTRITAEMASRVPFAVVGSEQVFKVEDQNVRARKYEWGTVEADNLKHSDLQALRYLLLCVGLPELIRNTDFVTYKRFRASKLANKGSSEPNGDGLVNPISQLENERIEMEMKLKEAGEKMEELFSAKITQKENMLAESLKAFEAKERGYKQENSARRERLKSMKTAFEREQVAMLNKYPSFSSYKTKKERKKSTVKLQVLQ